MDIEISKRDITAPGLYLMRWQKRTGLVRIVGEPKAGYTILTPEKPLEAYLPDLPKDGKIPEGALFSEPLQIIQV